MRGARRGSVATEMTACLRRSRSEKGSQPTMMGAASWCWALARPPSDSPFLLQFATLCCCMPGKQMGRRHGTDRILPLLSVRGLAASRSQKNAAPL